MSEPLRTFLGAGSAAPEPAVDPRQLALLERAVAAHERLAAAWERIAATLERESAR